MLEKKAQQEDSMKKLLLALVWALCLSIAASSARASTNIRFWHRNHKDAGKPPDASQPKPKRSLLRLAKPSREQAARSEATYGMTGPQSVGRRHPQPGPAGVGAK